jgi:hypothetical protein
MIQRPALAGLAWAALPVAAYFIVLQRLWFNAPILDDYDAVIWWPLKMADAKSLGEWLTLIVQQHNEHRIVVVRFAAWLMVEAGRLDFRVLMLLGNLTLVGFFLLAWLEFRREVAAPIFAAAALLLFQWSYYEASLMASAALPNIGAVAFSLMSLFFALRGGAASAGACVFFALLAVGSQASGLLALPVAAAGCWLAGRRKRALVFAAVAAVLWGAYFINYYKPGGHPPLSAAFLHPVDAVHLFLGILGGMSPWASAIPGTILAVAIGWLASRRLWRKHPTAALWIAYILLAAASVTVGRVGFGVLHAPRYAIYSSCLAVVVLLSVCALVRLENRAMVAAAIAWCLVASLLASWMNWPQVRQYSASGHALAKIVEVEGGGGAAQYTGVVYPVYAQARHQLVVSEQRGLYVPAGRTSVHAATVRVNASGALPARFAGTVDEVRAEGTHVYLKGWTDLNAMLAGRAFAIHGSPPALRGSVSAVERADIVKAHGPALYLSGFEMDLEYGSPGEAREAAESLCVSVDAPGAPPTTVQRGACGRR